MSDLGERFKTVRTARKLSQQKVADWFGITREAVSAWETNATAPDYDKVPRLLDELGVTSDWLLFERGDPPAAVTDLSRPGHKNDSTLDQSFVVFSALTIDAQATGGAIMNYTDAQKSLGLNSSSMRGAYLDHVHDLRVFDVVGNTMVSDPPGTDDLNPGDKVLVDTTDNQPFNGGLFVIWQGGGLVPVEIEHIQNSAPPMVELRSFNDRYRTYERPLAEVSIHGRIVARLRWI